MKKNEFVGIMEEINGAYGDEKFPLSVKTVNTWYSYIGEYEHDQVMVLVREYIETHPFPPAISNVLERLKEERHRLLDEISNSYKIMMVYCSSTDAISFSRFMEVCRGDEDLSRYLRRYVARYARSNDFGIKKDELECLLEKAVRAWDT